MDLFNKHVEQEGYGLSYDLWKNFPYTEIIALKDRNVGRGFFDDFLSFHATTAEGPYAIHEVATCTVEQVACEANAFGLCRFYVKGDTAEDEAVIQYGRGLGAPFYLTTGDLCFEARLRISAITAAKWALAVGLGQVGMAAADLLFIDTTGALADKNFVGFVKLKAEGGAVDGAYKADGQTYQDGAVQTKLDTLHTLVAATFVKLGFRFNVTTNTLHWYVNGVETKAAKLTSAQVTAALFPNDVFMAPVMGIKDAAGDLTVNLDLDWWACAQMGS